LRSVREGVERMEADGRTVAIVAADGTVVGAVGLADVVRPHAGDAVARLKREGVEVAMITGDQARTAAAVAAEIGITNVFAQVTPEGKAERVRALQAAGQRVAMVGDGTNDAPALAAADVGIAFAAGTDVANAAAHISLVSSELRLVPQAIQLARRSVRIIKQNLFWAFFYNVVAIPLAALDVVPPGYAAAAMMVSSLSVVTNSLRLQRLA
jgi:Cu+-exporting ATPase